MPPSPPDFRRRAQLTEWMDEPCSREELRACLRDLEKVNRWLLGYRPTLQWLDSFDFSNLGEPLRILDVGCGYGDTLRRISKWARTRNVAVELTGIDLNPDATSIAQEVSGAETNIEWLQGDVFSCVPTRQPHMILSALFTHHLSDRDVVRFVRWMESNALAGWFVNDLSRAPIPYRLFGWFAKVTGMHPFVQHDGPVSIARAFQEQEWRVLCMEAGLDDAVVEIRGFTPGRLCVGRRKLQ